jgi:hypothetical protein
MCVCVCVCVCVYLTGGIKADGGRVVVLRDAVDELAR